MVDPTPEQQQEQYAAIELLYSEGRWNDVLQASEALLAALPPVQNHRLRARLDLVIGHTLLYGLANANAAEQRYRIVLLETEEPVLREIAAHGLVRCNEQRMNSGAPAELEAKAMAGGVAAAEPRTASTTASTTEAALLSASTTAEVKPGISAAFTDSLNAPGSASADPTAFQQSGAAAMPWETAVVPGIAGDGGLSNSGSNAAMPWLAELGSAAPASPDEPGAAEAEPLITEPVANQALSDSVRTVRHSETATLQPPPLQMQAVAESQSPTAANVTPSATAEETLALLREPDELIPVTVQVLEDTTPIPESAKPEPAREEPPLSPGEMAKLARGLLEVVLR